MSYIFPRIEPISDSGALLSSHTVPEVIYTVSVPVTGSNTPAAAGWNLDAGAFHNTAAAAVQNLDTGAFQNAAAAAVWNLDTGAVQNPAAAAVRNLDTGASCICPFFLQHLQITVLGSYLPVPVPPPVLPEVRVRICEEFSCSVFYRKRKRL